MENEVNRETAAENIAEDDDYFDVYDDDDAVDVAVDDDDAVDVAVDDDDAVDVRQFIW